MNTLRTWALSLAAACLTGVIISFIKPNRSLGKLLDIMVGIFLIAAIVSPFTSSVPLEKQLDISVPDTAFDEKTASEYYRNSRINAAADSVKKELESALKKKKYTFEDVDVSMNIDKNNSIFISEVIITGVDSRHKQKIFDYIKKEYNLEVSVRENA